MGPFWKKMSKEVNKRGRK